MRHLDTMDFPGYFDLDLGSTLEQDKPWSKNSLKIAERKKKRKLDLVKCERCRLDRQKCNPVPRVWPTKCDRCFSRGFPCSEGKRVERKTKHAALLSKDLETDDEQDNLGNWSIMLSCNKIIGIALEELSTLRRDTLRPFIDQWVQEGKHKHDQVLQKTRVKDLENITDVLADLLWSGREEMSRNSSSLSLSALSALAGQTLVDLSYSYGHATLSRDKVKPHKEKILGSLLRRKDIGHEYLFRQRSLQIELRKGYPQSDFEKQEVSTLESLRKRILEKMNAILHSFNLNLSGLYNYPEVSSIYWIYENPELVDCLDRTSTLQWMDATTDKLSLKDARTMLGPIKSKNINKKDILNRTLLHVACQKGWLDGVEALLQNGADPCTITIFGHAPLHYAAAIGAADICKILLLHEDLRSRSHTSGFLYDTRDCHGNSPLYYAVGSKDVATIDVLLAHVRHGIPLGWNDQACPPPLIRAILDDEFDIANMMIKSGADPAITFQGQTAMEHLEKTMGQRKDAGRWLALKEEMDTMCSIAEESQESLFGQERLCD